MYEIFSPIGGKAIRAKVVGVCLHRAEDGRLQVNDPGDEPTAFAPADSLIIRCDNLPTPEC